MVAPHRAFLDPAGERLDVLVRERFRMVIRWRHSFIRIIRQEPFDHFRSLRVAGHDDGPARFALAERVLAIEIGNIAGLLHPAMAGGAVFGQDGPDVAIEINTFRVQRLSVGYDQGDGEDAFQDSRSDFICSAAGWEASKGVDARRDTKVLYMKFQDDFPGLSIASEIRLIR